MITTQRLSHHPTEQANILINDDGVALLADFGLMSILIEHGTVSFSATVTSAAGTVRWMSPELLFGTNSAPSRQSDRYALGMVVYEVSRPSSLTMIHHLSTARF